MAQEDAITISNRLIIQTPISGYNNTNKKKRNLPGNPDPEAEVISLSPKTLLATNRFLCEICGKGFQRDQNLQLHRRGHNLPWKLKQRNGNELRKRVYVCPETTCVHHNPLRALGDLTGIKKHFCRKHGEKKWKCEKCNKNYAVKSDWKAHSKTCGTREYKCDCGTIFSRRDSFITHRAFCDALAEEAARLNAASHFSLGEAVASNGNLSYNFIAPQQQQELFKSLLPNKESHEIITSNNIEELEAQKGYVPMWMGQMGQQGAHLHTDPTTMSDNNVFQQLRAGSIHGSLVSQQHLSWAIGNTNKMWSNSSQEQMASTSVPMMSASTSNTRQELVGSVHSLYSNHHQTPSLALAHMSATALLQKAAQLGAISNDPLQVLGNLRESNINEIQDHHQVSKYCSGSVGDLAGYGSNSTTTNLVGSDVESTTNEFSPMNSNTQMETNPLQLKRRRLMEDDHHGDGGQTRDFLGVGGAESICNPCSTNEWI